jgi:hypothetical protein
MQPAFIALDQNRQFLQLKQKEGFSFFHNAPCVKDNFLHVASIPGKGTYLSTRV